MGLVVGFGVGLVVGLLVGFVVAEVDGVGPGLGCTVELLISNWLHPSQPHKQVVTLLEVKILDREKRESPSSQRSPGRRTQQRQVVALEVQASHEDRRNRVPRSGSPAPKT